MKISIAPFRSVFRLGSMTLVFAFLVLFGSQMAKADKFTYQGKLDDLGGGPADGRFDIRVSAVTPPAPCFGTDCGWFTNCPSCSTISLGTYSVAVDKGYFTLPINMPTGMVYSVNGVYLQFAVRPEGKADFTTLWPMQELTPAPIATVARSVLGPIPASALTGQMPTGMLTGIFSSPLNLLNQANRFAGDGSQLANVNAATLGGFAPCDLPCFWKLTGNDNTTSNSFIGTLREQPLTLKANNEVVMRYVPRPGGVPGAALIGGSELNIIELGGGGSVICGGGGTEVNSPYRRLPNEIHNDGGAIVGGLGNVIHGRECFIGGGLENKIDDNNHKLTHYVTIAGGNNNVAKNVDAAFIGGGANNVVTGNSSVVVGGFANQATGSSASVGGGMSNRASGSNATVPGGNNNLASGSGSLAAGNNARAQHNGAFVWGDSQNAEFSSTADNQFAVRAQNGIMVSSTTTALDLRGDGAIRVAGAGVASRGPVFIHRATAANVSGHITTIDHPLANGDPNAILLVTHNYSADTSTTRYEPNTVGVWYDGSRWTIYHENTQVGMPAGRAYNVMIIKP